MHVVKDQNGVTEVVCCMREDGEVVMCQAPAGSCCSCCPFSRQSLVVFHWRASSVCLSFLFISSVGWKAGAGRGARSPAVGALPIGGLSRGRVGSAELWALVLPATRGA